MAAAGKHLSAQLMAPEQPFQATTATESVQAAPEPELSRAAKMDLPSTEHSGHPPADYRT